MDASYTHGHLVQAPLSLPPAMALREHQHSFCLYLQQQLISGEQRSEKARERWEKEREREEENWPQSTLCKLQYTSCKGTFAITEATIALFSASESLTG